jgi:hypothetical protein
MAPPVLMLPTVGRVDCDTPGEGKRGRRSVADSQPSSHIHTPLERRTTIFVVNASAKGSLPRTSFPGSRRSALRPRLPLLNRGLLASARQAVAAFTGPVLLAPKAFRVGTQSPS